MRDNPTGALLRSWALGLGTVFPKLHLMNLLSGANISLGFVVSCLEFSPPVGGVFFNESPFRGKSFCWVVDLVFEFQSSCRGTHFQ